MEFEDLKRAPHSLEAEQSILGSLIVDYRCMEDLAAILRPEHFYVEKYGRIYSEILEMYMTSAQIDFVTVLNRVVAAGIYEETEAKQLLYDMASAVPSTKNAAAYARIVAEKYNLRRLIGICDEITEACYAQNDEVQNILDMAESKIFEIRDQQSNTAMVELKTALLESFDRVSKIAQDRATYAGLQTSFRDLDRVLSGFGKSDLILLAARPGLGKTSLALNIAQNVGLQGKTVAIFSLEMSNEQLANRLLSSHSGVDNKKFRTGELTANEWVRLGQSSSVLARTHVYLDDTPDMTVAQMKAKLRRLPALDLIIVDYMQLMSSGTRTASRQEAVSEISRSMKMMAKEFNVPVLCLSQLSRASEKREGDKRPLPSDLRESGSIEQDADAIMFLYNDAIYNKETANPNKMELIIAKNRHGPTETVYLAWNNTLTKFSNYKAKKDAVPLPDEAPPV
ncbi:MAG: replicative DNA helicase [Clostridiales bacterium]|nr:MAG: replicative DNA helicase [Clostridiales bacterium]